MNSSQEQDFIQVNNKKILLRLERNESSSSNKIYSSGQDVDDMVEYNFAEERESNQEEVLALFSCEHVQFYHVYYLWILLGFKSRLLAR